MTKTLNVNVLPGEPLDGSGKVCIHLSIEDELGPFVEPHRLYVLDGKLTSRKARCRLACDKKRKVAPVVRAGVTTITPRTDDPRAVTCPKCCASPEYATMMESLTKV